MERVRRLQRHQDYVAVGHYSQSYYGVSLQDILDAYDKAERWDPRSRSSSPAEAGATRC
jgi:hypothetical protein